MHRALFLLMTTTFVPLAFIACKSDRPLELPDGPEAATETPAQSRIGVLLNERSRGEYQIGVEVVVVGTVPGSPAAGVLQENDVILAVQGTSTGKGELVSEIIGQQPVGSEITLLIRRDGKKIERKVHTEKKLTGSETLEKAYLGKTLPSFQGIVSVARTDGNGTIVPDSQCVISPKGSCDRYGKPGATNFADGPATAVLFLQWLRAERNNDLVATVRDWQEKLGARGLRVVAVTPAPPNAVPEAVKENNLTNMTVVSMFHGEYADATLALFAGPCVIVLDEKGVVRGAATDDGDELDTLRTRVITPLLTAPQ